MRIYRASWLAFCVVLGVPGLLVAFTWSPTPIILVFVCAAFSGWGIAMIVLSPEDTIRIPPHRRGTIAWTAALTGAATVAFIGLGTLLGAMAAVLLLVITAGGSPYATSRCVRWLREHGHLPEPAARPAAPAHSAPESKPLRIVRVEADRRPEPPAALSSLSDDALCLAWRTSFSALQRAQSAAQRLTVIEERRAYLDEIERRNAHGLAAWLASGPRAAGNPSRFVHDDGAHASIDWNELLHDTDQ
ncbi:hypothetical protein [Kribbella sp. NPDC048928]|uniref:hypothetical protein n=1 Tax=Kribbella sp. NPDC048928 TaxID=3364111 RepID=UPI00371DAD45